MKTRAAEERKRKYDRLYRQKCSKDEGKTEEKKKKDEERRKRRKIEERMTQDRLLLSEEKVKKLRKAQKKVEAPLPEKPIDHKDVQDPLEHIVDQPEEVKEEEEKVVKSELEVLEEISAKYIDNRRAIERFTSMSHEEFDAFVLECSPTLLLTTCTRILKRTTVAMAKVLANEIQFPSDDELEGLRYTAFQNFGFPECVCVVDGSEIRISRPN